MLYLNTKVLTGFQNSEDHSGIETDISETGNIGTKGETRGNRDEWRSVGDVMEIGTDLGTERYNGG